MHSWTENDDRVALYIYRNGTSRLPLMEAGIAKLLGIPEGSLARRQSNFAFHHGRPGLPNAAKQSRKIYAEHKDTTEPNLRAIVLHAFENARSS